MSESRNVEDSILKVAFVGEAQAKKFLRLRIKTVEDLLSFLPKTAVNLSSPQKIAKLKFSRGEKVLVEALAENLSVIKTPRRRMWLVKAKLRDGTGEITAIWFNQPYLRSFFKSGAKHLFYGEITHDAATSKPQLINPEIFPYAGIYLQYPQTEGLTSRQISRVIESAIEQGYDLPELVPGDKLDVRALHLPKSVEEFQKTKNQLIFEKLLVFILANLYLREKNREETAYKIKPDREYLRKFAAGLPFKLTGEQGRAIFDILEDFSRPYPMNRLLQGDVGSGKTIVALCAAILAIKSGYRVAWLAPTEILAQQHFETVKKFLHSQEVEVALWTAAAKISEIKNQKSNLKNKTKNIKLEVRKGDSSRQGPVPDRADLLIGTHALLQENVRIENLALVIVDEQHRFGVKQREHLAQNQISNLKNQKQNKKFENSDIKNSLSRCETIVDPRFCKKSGKIVNCKIENCARIPHFLSLSATPIPRTLAHIVFGNLDISTIREKPSGRRQVKTFFIPQNKRANSHKFIDKLISKGQQVFVICPLISVSRDHPSQLDLRGMVPITIDDRKTVESEVENLKRTVLGRRRIAALHGRMKAKEKDEIMRRMRDGRIDILVSTSVVEVGVDIPRAAVMVIEDAEHFGLSQLHQFRGRVGRNDLQSYCFLYSRAAEGSVPERGLSPKTADGDRSLSRSVPNRALERLKVFVQNSDGFKLAEMDLKQRGPGAILGTEQSGFRGLNPLWFENTQLLERASRKAKDFVSKLDDLPVLKKKVLGQLETGHLE